MSAAAAGMDPQLWVGRSESCDPAARRNRRQRMPAAPAQIPLARPGIAFAVLPDLMDLQSPLSVAPLAEAAVPSAQPGAMARGSQTTRSALRNAWTTAILPAVDLHRASKATIVGLPFNMRR